MGWISVTFKKPNDGRRSQDDILLPIYVLSTMSGKTAPDVSRERNLVWPAPGQYMQPSIYTLDIP